MINRFFGRGQSYEPNEDFIKGEAEDREIDIIETKDRVYLIFELFGLSRDDVNVKVEKNYLVIDVARGNVHLDR